MRGISNRVGKSETFLLKNWSRTAFCKCFSHNNHVSCRTSPTAQSGGHSLTVMRHGVQDGIPAFRCQIICFILQLKIHDFTEQKCLLAKCLPGSIKESDQVLGELRPVCHGLAPMAHPSEGPSESFQGSSVASISGKPSGFTRIASCPSRRAREPGNRRFRRTWRPLRNNSRGDIGRGISFCIILSQLIESSFSWLRGMNTCAYRPLLHLI